MAVYIEAPLSGPYVHPTEELALREFIDTLDRTSVLRAALEEITEALTLGDEATITRPDRWAVDIDD